MYLFTNFRASCSSSHGAGLASLNAREDIPDILPAPRQWLVLANVTLFVPRMLTKSSEIPILNFLLIV